MDLISGFHQICTDLQTLIIKKRLRGDEKKYWFYFMLIG